jgi:Tol biopolymer transport system component
MSKQDKFGLRNFIGIAGFLFVVVVLFVLIKTSASAAGTSSMPANLQTNISSKDQSSEGRILFVSEKSGNPEIYTMLVDGTDVTKLTDDTTKNYSPKWSPDGKRIGFVNENNNQTSLTIMNADGSSKSALSQPTSDSLSFNWSSDGKWIEYTESSTGDPKNASLYLINSDGKGKPVVIDGEGNNSFKGWSVDGSLIVYEKDDSKSGKKSIYLINQDGTGRKELAQLTGSSIDIKWRDSTHFYAAASSTDHWGIYLFDIDRSQPKNIVSNNQSGIATWFTGDNSLTYVVNKFESWTWTRLDGEKTTVLSTWPNYASQCKKYSGNKILGGADNTASPDGMYGLVAIGCDEGDTVFYLVNHDGSQISQLFGKPIASQFLQADWSPDGKELLLVLGNNQSGTSDFYLIDVSKTMENPATPMTQLTTDSVWKYDPSWQPLP